MNLNEQKKVAKDEYMEAKKKYLKTMSTEDWKVFCDKKEFVCCQVYYFNLLKMELEVRQKGGILST